MSGNTVRITLTPEQIEQARNGYIDLPITPDLKWLANGEPDPHGRHFQPDNIEELLANKASRKDILLAYHGAMRAADAKFGNMTDDQLANAVFLYDHRGGLQSIMFLTAAKERIRWLSRLVRSLVSVES